MKKIRRWLLMFAVIIALMVEVDGLRASFLRGGAQATATPSTLTSTASLFPTTTTSTPTTTPTTTTTTTSTTTTTTTEVPAKPDEGENPGGEPAVASWRLTGIPQIDYQWDPNLPRELNGFNLSTYPFLDSVPPEDEIGFTCDPKLHDGFYASIKYNCQLYHHCINGIRYNFLCPNFTAFDQKTFICHFASEVDCKSSPKYWFRNDQLYKATTTTTTTTTSTAPPPTQAPKNEKPLRKPARKRRPQIDDYFYDDYGEDDYYEERPRRRKPSRQRKPYYEEDRPRVRKPIYDDEYDEEDERFSRRPNNRNRDRERDRDYADAEYDRRPYSSSRTRDDDRRRPMKNRRPMVEDEPPARPLRRRPNEERRRPMADLDEDEEPIVERKITPKNEGKKRKQPVVDDDFEDEDRRRPAETNERPKRPVKDDRRSFSNDDDSYNRKTNDVVTVKPVGSSSIYDRPRTAPRIARPVPMNEKNKYAYGKNEDEDDDEPPKKKKAPTTTTTTTSTTSTTPLPPPAPQKNQESADIEYYDDYEDDAAIVPVNKKEQVPLVKPKPAFEETKTLKDDNRDLIGTSADVVYYDDIIIPKEDLRPKKENLYARAPPTALQQKPPPSSPRKPTYNEPSQEEFEDDFKPIVNPSPPKENKSINSFNKNRNAPPTIVDRRKVSQQAAPTYDIDEQEEEEEKEERNVKDVKPIVRVVKRPFLPSRGGNPFTARGLQPVGAMKQQEIDLKPVKVSRPSPFKQQEYDSSFQKSSDSRTTNRPENDNVKIKLDQIYDEYDVTLNDALNPTLKPITRSNPTFNRGFNRYEPPTPYRQQYEPAVYQSAHSTNRRSAILLQQHAPSRIQHFSRYQGYSDPVVAATYVDY